VEQLTQSRPCAKRENCSGVSVSAEGVDGCDRIIGDRMIFWGEEVVWEGRMALAWEVSENVSESSAGPF